ncbi:MAG: hypothetical protein FWE90_14150 [Defluviitaleaceae bacterium]|nr:hypothetical protein [Defluviitaleaceae bacterium]
MHNIIRIFPRRTKATPDDSLAFTTSPTKEILCNLNKMNGNIKEAHVSVAFTYDMPKAVQLAQDWYKAGFGVKMGGPAFNSPGGDFVPGLYLKEGYVITSRGCHGSCWFCSSPQREGGIRELPIQSGWNVLDDNLLACSDSHIKAVFEMLFHQPQRPVFTGGLDKYLLQEWHVDLLRQAKTERMYFAYDSPEDFDALINAGKMLRDGGIKDTSGHKLKCYVLIGYPDDTMANAEKRLFDTWRAGFWPYAMLYRNEQGETAEDWRKFQRTWARPQIVYHMLKNGT